MNTEPITSNSQKKRFGLFEADLATGELRRAGVKVRIQSKPFQVLASLLERPGEMVSREELQQRLWPEGTTVDFDHGLGIAVNKLRDALGDSADNPVFVETLARRGFRFIAPVQVTAPVEDLAARIAAPKARIEEFEQAEEFVPAPVAVSRRPWLWWLNIGFDVALVTILLVIVLRTSGHNAYQVEQITSSGNVLADSIELHDFSVAAVDGPRIYFVGEENGNYGIAEALLANGETTSLNLPESLVNPHLLALSPDGSSLLVEEFRTTSLDESLWIVQTLGGNSHRIPELRSHDGVWMPDGKHLLLARGTELDEVNEDGSDLRKVVSLPNPAFWLRWSPDKTRLRYTVWDQKTRTTSLWEMDAEFQNQHPLLPDWSHPSSECCGSWTANGSFYTFQSVHSGHTEIWKLRERPWILRDWTPQQVTNGPLDSESPTPSGSDDMTYYVGVNPQIVLVESTADHKDFTFLNHELRSAGFLKYSRDGKWLAWLNASDGSLWRSRADGSERVQLVHPPTRVFNMEWSPDDKQLAVMAVEPGGPWRVFRVNSEGGPLERIVDESHQQADPTWTPDGKRIVFGRLGERMSSDEEPSAVYEYDLENRKLEKIPGSENLFSPRVSPDGDSILAMTKDQTRLVVYSRKTGKWATLVEQNVGDPMWSSDGREIYFQNYQQSRRPILKVNLATRQMTEVASMMMLRTVPASDFRLISLAPEERIVASIRTSTVNLYSIHLK